MLKIFDPKLPYLKYVVWTLRIAIGATFILSGIAKVIDLWGFVYKIEQYLNVWGVPPLRTIVFMTALAISAVEFIVGVMLATGSYKRLSVYIASLLMLVMLPLSVYIVIADPVEDCGCFGDLFVVSNTATLIKNIVIVGAISVLILYNAKVKGLFHRYTQWMQAVICVSYVLLVGLIGYNVQPLVDFREFKNGTSIFSEDTKSIETSFVYEKDGQKETFNYNNLPDSTWTFVERIDGNDVASDNDSGLVITIDGEDVTQDVISDYGEQLLLLIPEVDRADISYTYTINEINRYIEERGGSMVGLIATNEHGLEYWRDISLAEYDLYSMEDTEVKAIARGHISLVYLIDGVIQWKRTLSSINDTLFSNVNVVDALSLLYFNGTRLFWIITAIHAGLMLILLIFDKFSVRLRRKICRKNKKKNVTLQSEKTN